VARLIKAVTFDYWNTLYSGNSGVMNDVWPLRFAALREALRAAGAQVTDEELGRARTSSFDAYVAAWEGGSHFGAREHVLHVLSFFGATAPSEAVDDATSKIEEASLRVRLQLLPGVRETIPALAAAGYRLGIISDTSLTPGRLLLTYLESDGLISYFSTFTFSDETGFPKPDPRMFKRTLETLDARPEESAHVGDTPRTDIAGARALGMLAVRYAAAADHEEPPEADFVIRDHRELPDILASQGDLRGGR